MLFKSNVRFIAIATFRLLKNSGTENIWISYAFLQKCFYNTRLHLFSIKVKDNFRENNYNSNLIWLRNSKNLKILLQIYKQKSKFHSFLLHSDSLFKFPGCSKVFLFWLFYCFPWQEFIFNFRLFWWMEDDAILCSWFLQPHYCKWSASEQ